MSIIKRSGSIITLTIQKNINLLLEWEIKMTVLLLYQLNYLEMMIKNQVNQFSFTYFIHIEYLLVSLSILKDHILKKQNETVTKQTEIIANQSQQIQQLTKKNSELTVKIIKYILFCLFIL